MKILNDLDQSEKSVSYTKEHPEMQQNFMEEEMEELRRHQEQQEKDQRAEMIKNLQAFSSDLSKQWSKSKKKKKTIDHQ